MTDSQYVVRFVVSARKSLDRLPRTEQRRVQAAIELLAGNPRPPRCKLVKGQESVFRIRVGNYRVLYWVGDTIRVIEIRKVAHRREAYR